MGFEPFGYRIEIDAAAPPPAVKSAIRSRKRSWLDPKNGPRGWILGPFLCLWWSAFDSTGPMIIARIVKNRVGTRIVGRAGSNLNGVMALVLMLVVAVMLGGLALAGHVPDGPAVVFGLAFLLPLTIVVLLMAHKDRRKAEPLDRFIREAVGASARSKGADPIPVTVAPKMPAIRISPDLTLDANGKTHMSPISQEMIRDALDEARANGFVIIYAASEEYIQTAADGDGFVLEIRKGGPDSHFEAVRTDPASKRSLIYRRTFTFEETLAALLAYGSGTPMPGIVDWKPVSI